MKEHIKEKIPIYFLLAVEILFILYCTLQNFVLCEDFSLLSIHGIDDAAFAESVRKLYASQGMEELLVQNDFGYGWIYWISVALFTLPGKFLYDQGITSVLYILLPRFYSMIFAILSVYVFYRLCRVYIKSPWLVATATLLFPLFPTMMHFSQRFSTTPSMTFFALLCVYFIVKDERLKPGSFWCSSLSLAIALGIKLTAVAIVPLFLLLMFSRFAWKFNKENIIIWVKVGIPSAYLALFCVSPAIALTPLFKEQSLASRMTIVQFIQSAAGKDVSLLKNMENGIIKGQMYWPLYAILFFCLCTVTIIKFKQKDSRKSEWGGLLSGYMIGIVLICKTATNGPTYATMYSTILSFIPLLSLALFECVSSLKITGCVVSAGLLLGQTYYINPSNASGFAFPINFFMQTALTSQSEIQLVSELKSVSQRYADENGLTEYIIVIDAGLPNFLPKLSNKYVDCYSCWNDLQNWNLQPVTFIVLDKIDDSRLWYLPHEQRTDGSLAEDYADRQALIETGLLQGISWDLIEETDEYYFFARAQGQ